MFQVNVKKCKEGEGGPAQVWESDINMYVLKNNGVLQLGCGLGQPLPSKKFDKRPYIFTNCGIYQVNMNIKVKQKTRVFVAKPSLME